MPDTSQVDHRIPKTVLITGAAGNLGGKLAPHLAQTDWCRKVIAIDRDLEVLQSKFVGIPKIEPVEFDLTTSGQAAYNALVSGVDAIVHFAITNPLPDSTWDEALDGIEMTTRLLEAARVNQCQRFVFTSSNHSLGQYSRPPLIETLTPGCLTTDMTAPGTLWDTPDGKIVGYAYGAGKIVGERLCKVAASWGGLTAVSIRVGWCQPGENHPRTLNAGGNPNLAPAADTGAEVTAELRWYRNMWLSNRDFQQIFERAIIADAAGWDAPGITVNGMSGNEGMSWDIESAARLIGYHPADDVWSYV